MTDRALRESLRARIRTYPGDLELRRLLAESYRRDGHLDQAARWGLLVTDFTTPRERQALSRATRFSSEDELRGYLEIDDSTALPPAAVQLLPTYLASSPGWARRLSEELTTAATVTALFVAGMVALFLVVTFIVALAGGSDVRIAANIGVFIVAATANIPLLCVALSLALTRRPIAAACWALPMIGLIWLAAAFDVTGAGDGSYFG